MTLFDMKEVNPDKRPLTLLNITDKPYLDMCVEHIANMFEEYVYDVDLDDFKKITKEYIRKYNVFNTFDELEYYKKIKDCVAGYDYLQNCDEDKDDVSDIDFTEDVNDISRIVRQYYTKLLEAWNPELEKNVDLYGKYMFYKNDYWGIAYCNDTLKTTGIRNNCKYVTLYNEDLDFNNIISKEKYYWIKFFSKKFFKALKHSFRTFKYSFNEEIYRI